MMKDTPKKSIFSQTLWRDLALLAAVTIAVRALVLIILPPRAVSLDLYSWVRVAKILGEGGNPYNLTSVLNWPPLWMQVVFALSKLSAVLQVPFFRCVQALLVLLDVGIAAMLYAIIQSYFANMKPLQTALFGIALNPIVILLTCQHSTSDGLMVFWIMAFAWFLLDWNKRKDPISWLIACLFLGLGVLTKTVPLALVPLLAAGSRRLPLRVRGLGAIWVAGPSALGLSILYVLGPHDIATKVIGYRAVGRWFGLTGLMQLAGHPGWADIYSRIFTVLFLSLLAFLFYRLSFRAETPARALILLGVTLLMAIPGLGPGYSPTYIFAFLPLLIVSFDLFDRSWKLMVTVFLGLACVTYLIEYALLPSHGFSLVVLSGMSDRMLMLSGALSGQEAQTMLRLPLFGAYLLTLWMATKKLQKDFATDRR